LPYLARLLGGPPPGRVTGQEAEEQIGVQAVYYGIQLGAASNARARSELGFAPAFPSWRDGFRRDFA
jgi:hypothetical protein